MFQILEPFDKVKDPSAVLDRGHNFLHIVFLTLLNVVHFPEYPRGVRRGLVFTCSVWFEEQDMEDIVDLPFSRQREVDGEWGDDFLDLKGTLIFVVQLLCWVTHFDVAAVEHHQVSYLVCWGFFSYWVGVPAYSFLCRLQSFPGFLVYCLHPMPIDHAGWVEWFLAIGWVQRRWVESKVGIKRHYSVTDRNQVVIGKLCHWQERCPVILFLADKHAEVCLDCLIELFCLSVSLGVEGSRHTGTDSK